jgi:hypothetical protein
MVAAGTEAAAAACAAPMWLMATGRLAAVIREPSSRIMARSMALRSSRTLPGQSWAINRLSASGVTASIRRLNLLL